MHSWVGWGSNKLSDDSTHLKLFVSSCLYGKYIKQYGNIDIGQANLLSKGVRPPTNLSSGEKKFFPAYKLGHHISYSAAWQLLVGNTRNRIRTLIKSRKIWQVLQLALDFTIGIVQFKERSSEACQGCCCHHWNRGLFLCFY